MACLLLKQLLFLTFTVSLNCQSDPNNLVFNGNKESMKQNFTKAEVEYRKAISNSVIQNKASRANCVLKSFERSSNFHSNLSNIAYFL